MTRLATMDGLELAPKSPNYPARSAMAGESSEQRSGDNRVDSGYSSLSATPANDPSSEKSSGRFKRFSTEGNQTDPCARRLFSPWPDLVAFEKPLDDGTLHWFEATAPRIEQLLVEFLKSSRRALSPKFKPIAVRLMVLGHSETSAQPHLVVFAPPKGSKKIKRFFAKEEIKDLLVPSDAVGSVPVVVTAHTTSFLMCLISDIKALCSADATTRPSRHTLCGLPIVVNSRRMTLGGIVRVLVPASNDKSEWKLYGLSAGHFRGNSDEGHEDEVEESDDDSDPEPDTDSGGDNPMHDPPIVRPALPPPIASEATSWDWRGTMTLGNILEIGNDSRPAGCADLDWSLIHMNCLLPNFLNCMSMDTRDGNYRMADLVAPHSTRSSSNPFSVAPYRNIVVASGTRGLQRGRLHGNPTRVMLGRSENFSNAYILKLDNGTVGSGDSGSWVVDPCTSEVLGHVVAKDVFGDAYVIPMADILNDIKSRLGCIDVGLPSSLDVFSEATALKEIINEATGSLSGSPKRPTADDPLVDSGYNTNANGTPCLDPPAPLAPTTTEIHAVIRASLPQELGINPREFLATASSRASVNKPTSDRVGWKRKRGSSDSSGGPHGGHSRVGLHFLPNNR